MRIAKTWPFADFERWNCDTQEFAGNRIGDGRVAQPKTPTERIYITIEVVQVDVETFHAVNGAVAVVGELPEGPGVPRFRHEGIGDAIICDPKRILFEVVKGSRGDANRFCIFPPVIVAGIHADLFAGRQFLDAFEEGIPVLPAFVGTVVVVFEIAKEW